MKLLALAFAMMAAALLSGCGFTPLYATPERGGSPGLRSVHLANVVTSETARPTIERAFERRTASGGGADYDLEISVREGSNRLAVQIDASVTRYNYRLIGRYTLRKRSNGSVLRGRAEASASFNVVSSQYSTLYAEQAAREKAARVLAEEVERDILIKLAARRKKAVDAVADQPEPEPDVSEPELSEELTEPPLPENDRLPLAPTDAEPWR